MLLDLCQDKGVSQIDRRLKDEGGGRILAAGTWGSFARLLTAYVSGELQRPVLLICPHIDDADRAVDDLHTFGAESVQLLAAWEGAEELADATDEIRSERAAVALGVSQNHEKFLTVASIQALCQPIPPPAQLQDNSLALAVDKGLSPEVVTEWLVENSFERTDRVDLPGQFARRGGIIDIYAPLCIGTASSDTQAESSSQPSQALRIEFFGDTIESIRRIDLDTNLSAGRIDQISIVSAVSGTGADADELFLNILCEEVARVFKQRLDDSARLFDWSQIHQALNRFKQLHMSRFATSTDSEVVNLGIKSIQQFQHTAASSWAGHKEALAELVEKAKAGNTVYLYCEAAAEIKRLTEIITEEHKKVPINFKLLKGFVHQGFCIDSLRAIVIGHQELFGQLMLRRKPRAARAAAPLDSLADLQPGELVVHASYGIGKYLGIRTIEEKGGTSEYLTIEYADGVTIQASANNIALVQKYIGTSPKRPKLSKVGSKRWQKQKEKVARSVKDLAAELLEVQAKRQALGGIAYGDDSNWQSEFEESFPYQETPDQTTAAEQIKADMRQPVAMDRLLCGDVGYGKTELAMRAAFKAVEAGRQVALLVPTTVLCVQHGRTFTERFADFPISIEVLNRFKTPAQAADIIKRTKQGKVDILIGTHRLLSGDVGFKDLGLLIIDEEQRFGVEHKERLKRLRVNVDVLTMTATPIPRTLHMSLLGLRDISSLATPPLDRRSIVTQVCPYNTELVRKAILRELGRCGQVFFVHNRIKTIDKVAWELSKLLGDAKIRIAHGRMSKSELESAMIEFVLGDIDVLVCTTIIESGLDIPNANTIFIDNADRFGLAELHQLRGRVGRYKHRAYAYILLPKKRSITPIAARRLKAIEEYSHLGAGFRIALRDLEIRGAGNILGAEQSGHIQLVGYQMYCELLAEAVRRLKGEHIEAAPAVNLDLGFTTYIPKSYIPADRHRMDTYRRIATAKTDEDLKQIGDELADVYGPLPEQVQTLLELAWIRIAAGKAGIKSIVVDGRDLAFTFMKDADIKSDKLFAKVKGRVTVTDDGVVYLRLAENYFEPPTLVKILHKIFNRRLVLRKEPQGLSIVE
jgi:transcription-repair coupling factor (superfamily II helicase)